MKRLTKWAVVAAGASIMATSIAWSYPVQYTIEGTVIEGPGIHDSAGFLADLGITVGSPVSYTLIIDLDAKGTILWNDGTVTEVSDGPSGDPISFYAHYVSGSTSLLQTIAASIMEYWNKTLVRVTGRLPPHRNGI